MTLDENQRIGQLLCVSLSGEALTRTEREMLARIQPGGVILFARNCQSPQQVRALTDDLRAELGAETLIAIDQEGGKVDRLRAFVTPMPAAEEVAVRGGAQAAATLGKLTARALRLLGLNFNFAPVLDVLTPARRELRNGLQSRTFGETPQKVAECATAYLRALQEGEISGCVKHFPGLGGAEVDPHHKLPIVAVSREEFEAVDLGPFRAVFASGLARAVMVSHAAYPNLNQQGGADENVPASLSKHIVTDLLRGECGFDGVALTDDLTMGAAITAAGSLPQAACRAVAAGHDLLLLCAAPEQIIEAHAALRQQCSQGDINPAHLEQSFQRLERLRRVCAKPERFDEEHLQAISTQLSALHADLGVDQGD